MNQMKLIPFQKDTALTGYMPLPRELVGSELPATAIMLYASLLDRATLSQKNLYTDNSGHVYVIYSTEHLAENLQISTTMVKRYLRLLENNGLIRRCRESGGRASHIYLYLPSGSSKVSQEDTKCTASGAETSSGRVQKVPTNNRRKQHKYNNDYQHSEEESL